MRLFSLSMMIFWSISLYSQASKFVIQSNTQGVYLSHKVSPKENWYSIGRIYEISPREIAPFNNMTLENGLRIGQELKIPLLPANFDQDSETPSGIPVVYVVGNKDVLYRIASDYSISVDKLKKWNGLKSEQLKAGSELVVGYIHGTGVTSTLHANTPASVTVAKPSNENVTSKPNEAVKKSSSESKMPDVKQEPVKEAAPVLPKSAVDIKPVNPQNAVELHPLPGIGFFNTLYNQQSKEGKIQNLEGFVYGIFKSTSGWEDQKYYVLLNDVVPGTIVKINVRGTEKSIYAKVLGAVPAGKESEGMTMRMSNASAAALGLEDSSASLLLSWYK